MRQAFRPLLEPPSHRRAVVEARRRPVICLTVTLVAVLLVVTIFGLSAWNLSEHRFGQNTLRFHNGDEVALSQVADDFSVTFCDSYKVSLPGPGQAVLLADYASVNTTFTDDIHVDLHQPPYREFNVRYTYLLRKSSVNVTACRKSGPISPEAEIIFIQGDDNLKRWRRNNYCDDCVLERIHISEDAYCDGTNRRLPRLYHVVDSDDTYFLVVFNGRPGPRHRILNYGIFLSGVFSRTHFDLSDAEEVCHMVNTSSCLFDLPWMSSKDVVIKFEGPAWNNYHTTMTTHCQARVIFWVCLFGIVPLVCIFLVLIMFGCFLLRRMARNTKRTRCYQEECKGERTRLLQDQDRQFTNQVPQNEENDRMAIQFG